MTINVEQFIPYAYWLAGLVLAFVILRIANVFRYIPNNQVGIVEKLWSPRGSIQSGFIALNGEGGFEPEVLRGGLHVLFPFMYRIHRSDLVTVGQGQIATCSRATACRSAPRRCSAPMTPRTNPTSRTLADS